MASFQCNHDGTCDKVKLCCMQTEMTLTKADAERIDKLGYDRKEYLRLANDGFCELVNVDGHCYFYVPETGLCKIYEHRPEGCRYYPIVYNARKRKCVVDGDCPSGSTVTRQEIRDICHRVRNLIEQLMREAAHGDRAC